jgi:hypothetical protein
VSFTPGEIDRIKRSNPITEVVGRYVTWDKKKSRKGDMWACCPFHGEKSPSFHADDKRGIYKCFSCGAAGDVIEFIQQHNHVSFAEAVRILGGQASAAVDPEQERRMRARRAQQQAQREGEQKVEATKRAASARSIFDSAVPVAGTLAERYLIGRGIGKCTWPTTLRYANGIDYDLEPGLILPALVCAATDKDDRMRAVWRIYLDRETGGKAKVENAKLGKGPAAGCAVRLGPAAETIKVCEGVETGLAIREIGSTVGDTRPVWCALSTSGMAGLEVPETVRRVLIYYDDDMPRFDPRTGKMAIPPGKAAALKLAARMQESGREAVLVGYDVYGSDWLDVLNTYKMGECLV